ncbi:alpha/beta fold hydrolase [Roseateles sp. DAIF2]|uniref:alpha/beta hydrolase n=1 Tax=Roseateles sp. DAIF2 TaxID=2714952 RepID=UPI0018A2BD28|nr:alpha/beta fold hydrolase [Roseateles sp. DAIF2]QPF76149.1 alpha/beta fold hydrolase [Roseateles sp. DAIF2]
MSAGQPPGGNPAALFYGQGGGQRLLRRGLDGLQRLSPALAAALAFRFFITPLPSKLAARRRPMPADWKPLAWRAEDLRLCAWQHRDALESHGPRPRVLLVHGWAGDARQMLPLAEALWAAGFDPLLLDMPAHGRSAGWQSHLPAFVATLLAAGERFGPLQGLVAHSLGALAASQALARGLAAERLVLLAASAPPRQVLAWYGASFGLGAPVLARLRARLEGLSGAALESYEPAWLAERLRQPTLLLHDRDDRAAPLAAAQALAVALPAARLQISQGLGHRRLLADPATLEAVSLHLR